MAQAGFLAAKATPVNWQPGKDVIIAGSVSNDEAREIFGTWKEPKPYIRIVPQPGCGPGISHRPAPEAVSSTPGVRL